MSRVKRGVTANKRRKYLLKKAKGYLNGGSTKYRTAKERLLKAETNAYKSRRIRKRDFRKLWISRINGALDQIDSPLSYSRFINLVEKSELGLNRKALSEMAFQNIDSFKEVVELVEKSEKK
jgi:large subunit ribosomal protein L20